MYLKSITPQKVLEIFGKDKEEHSKLWWKGDGGTICNRVGYLFPRANEVVNYEWFIEEDGE
ncbi:hypothetical protein ACFFH2_15715 [Enterococcus devriesei]|uniref:hypothetical protein n=1 Tax=Enterococcus devriesei TaxID=319970 RepID=UPI0008FFE5E8|nr:hypothetical protein [Enterococcus devriesei]